MMLAHAASAQGISGNLCDCVLLSFNHVIKCTYVFTHVDTFAYLLEYSCWATLRERQCVKPFEHSSSVLHPSGDQYGWPYRGESQNYQVLSLYLLLHKGMLICSPPCWDTLSLMVYSVDLCFLLNFYMPTHIFFIYLFIESDCACICWCCPFLACASPSFAPSSYTIWLYKQLRSCRSDITNFWIWCRRNYYFDKDCIV